VTSSTPGKDVSDITLREYCAGSPLLEAGFRVYQEVWPEREDEFEETRESFVRYAGYPDFAGVVAFAGERPVGVGYGARSFPGVWWHDQVTPVLGKDYPALQDAWRLVELAVVTDARRHGIGGMIHDHLLTAHTCSRALLCTGVGNTVARAMYASRGWQVVHPGFDFPGQPVQYVILGKELRAG
jgi:ribosomal protein S18 acetylase RimI-like enzyme